MAVSEAAHRGSLWVLYVVKQIPTSFKIAIGGCSRQLQRERAQRSELARAKRIP